MSYKIDCTPLQGRIVEILVESENYAIVQDHNKNKITIPISCLAKQGACPYCGSDSFTNAWGTYNAECNKCAKGFLFSILSGSARQGRDVVKHAVGILAKTLGRQELGALMVALKSPPGLVIGMLIDEIEKELDK